MTVFDVDGTLVGGEPIDWKCFEDAFADIAGYSLSEEFFTSLTEVTAAAIIHHALSELPPDERTQQEHAIRDLFLQKLQDAHRSDPTCFPATPGAKELLQELHDRQLPFAIATGDWRVTICFKLEAAGIPYEHIPMVTSSEFHRRADIIAAAVQELGRPLTEAAYVGDGLWDLHACSKLDIPFIGVGHRHEQLAEAGASTILTDLEPTAFWKARNALTPPPGPHA